MRVLLDTCILSEMRRADERACQAVEAVDDASLFLSVITIGEIAKGIALLPSPHRKEELTLWLSGLEKDFSTRILPIDHETATIWGEITARGIQAGKQIATADGLIAATALRYGLHLMTRNTRDFKVTGALIIDPWGS